MSDWPIFKTLGHLNDAFGHSKESIRRLDWIAWRRSAMWSTIFLVFAVLFTCKFFPVMAVRTPFMLVLAFSIYAASACGVAALVVEIYLALKKAHGAAPAGANGKTKGEIALWKNNALLSLYLLITLAGAAIAGYLTLSPHDQFKSSQSEYAGIDTRGIGRDARNGIIAGGNYKSSSMLVQGIDELCREGKDEKECDEFGGRIVMTMTEVTDDEYRYASESLEHVAFLVVCLYCLADLLAFVGTVGRQYGIMLAVDVLVLLIHLVATFFNRESQIFPFDRMMTQSFWGGVMALTLLAQCGFFSYVLPLMSPKDKTPPLEGNSKKAHLPTKRPSRSKKSSQSSAGQSNTDFSRLPISSVLELSHYELQ